MKNLFYALLVIALLSVYSCSKDETEGKLRSIPDVEVKIRFSPDHHPLLYSPLATMSFTEYYSVFTGKEEEVGYGGIIIINGIDSIKSHTQDYRLYAFDMACPVECDKSIRVVVDDMAKATCPNCGAIYNLWYGRGNCEDKPKYALKQYKVERENHFSFLITNPNYKR